MITPQEMSQNKAQFINYCQQYIQREGINALLDYLEKTDFYTAPSSASYHLNVEGGLCRHSLNVFETAIKVYDLIVGPQIQAGNSPFTQEISKESIAIVALFHDVCKTKFYKKTEKWKKDENNRWVSYPGYEIEDEFPFGHGEKSCIILHWFIKLKQDELLAIRWHMGMFEMTEQGSGTRCSYRAAMEKSPLVTLLQVCDLLSANCFEPT
ncbi:protein containing Metal-dependent phosphohydrolase, HD region, subdomain protein, partial [gut metagenome]